MVHRKIIHFIIIKQPSSTFPYHFHFSTVIRQPRTVSYLRNFPEEVNIFPAAVSVNQVGEPGRIFPISYTHGGLLDFHPDIRSRSGRMKF